jgi:hypothetical protein
LRELTDFNILEKNCQQICIANAIQRYKLKKPIANVILLAFLVVHRDLKKGMGADEKKWAKKETGAP